MARLRSKSVVWLSITALSGLLGCSSAGTLDERLDPASGVTVIVQREPLVFVRTQPQYSRSARDYLYVGPIEINDQGTREYFLWVGLGSTLDRDYLGVPPTRADALLVEVEGDLLELPLLGWNDRAPHLGLEGLYRTPVRLNDELAARVTLDQLEMIAEAPLESVRLAATPGTTAVYYRWKSDRARIDAFTGALDVER